ncbi:hypothetical protein SERLA73DRAFT_85360 [Serpula lacrymans var. lacrymans S7.3]|uniref:Uncharacterized protein n=1 Tax=Serpula lacrymans var. lacrymans (strain S7.3) TaxID=936435 RepID=F8PQP3_SERL3|nr:hypothetical protein SERLA73DRAFT_85360 [Serpula lacrymans var. lacrymans S7.3]
MHTVICRPLSAQRIVIPWNNAHGFTTPKRFSVSAPSRVIQTPLTDVLNIRAVGVPPLAAAISNAGGLGNITALSQPNPDALRTAIREMRHITSKPFSVNITTLPAINPPDYQGYAKAAIDEGVRIFETAGDITSSLIAYFKSEGCIVLYKGVNIEDTKTAIGHGADVITLDANECVGFSWEEEIGGIVLLPLAAKELKVPFVASGGLADGRGLAGALALGASVSGFCTRIMCTKESTIHQSIKEKMVQSNETDTVHIFKTLNNKTRVFKNKISKEVVALESRPGGAQFEELRPLVAGARGRLVYENGDPDHGIWAAGLSLGLIHDIPSCEELLRRIESEAEDILAGGEKFKIIKS